jgi:hypothetical protein
VFVSAHVAGRNFAFQEFVRYEEGLHGFTGIAATRGNGLVGSGFKPFGIGLFIGRGALGHGVFQLDGQENVLIMFFDSQAASSVGQPPQRRLPNVG